MTEPSRRLAFNIRWLARRQNVVLTRIPDIAHSGQGYFFTVLAGRASPTVKWCWKIAKVLRVDIHELFKP